MSKVAVLCSLALALGLGVVHGSAGDKGGDKKPEQKPEPKLNSPPDGFRLLFNGKDLEGWQGLIDIKTREKLKGKELEEAQKIANEKILPHWKVQNGILVYDGKGNNLQTAKDYGDFELYVDWKIGKGGDSGIYLRGNPQVQIWDHKDGSGGLYNNQKNPKDPKINADYPVGQWNTFYIKMVGDKVTVLLNGIKVVDNVPLENYWDKGKKPLPASGPIELQHHGNQLWFRNIYIKELQGGN